MWQRNKLEINTNYKRKIIFYFTLIFVFFSCQLHKVKPQLYKPLFPLEKGFSLKQKSTTKIQKLWYKEFKNPELNKLIKQALQNSFTLKQAWSRLRQANYQAKLAGASLKPNLNFSLTANSNDQVRDTASLRSRWEIDLWKRISNTQAIELSKIKKNKATLQNTALVLSTSVATNYFNLQTSNKLQKIIKKQIANAKQIIQYIKLIKTTKGTGTIIDFQNAQRNLLQLQDSLEQNHRNTTHFQQSLAILLGKSPISYKFIPKAKLNDQLPALPHLLTPKDLIQNNSTLKARLQTLTQKNYNIAISLAGKLPTLNTTTSYSNSARNLRFVSRDFVFNFVTSLTQSIYDGGKSSTRIKISKEQFQESLYAFSQTYLETLRNIERALRSEHYLHTSLSLQKKRFQLVRKNIAETKKLYSNAVGINFRSLLNDIQTSYQSQVATISITNNLLATRVSLHLALGHNIIKQKEK